MGAKNQINGKVLTNMLEIGRTIKKKASVFSTMPMGINTKVDGHRTKDTAKAHTGWQMPKIN